MKPNPIEFLREKKIDKDEANDGADSAFEKKDADINRNRMSEGDKKQQDELKKIKVDDLVATLVEWSLLSHVDCFPKIFQTKNVIGKILWSIFLFIFSGATIWLVTSCIIAYFEYEVVSKIEIVNERPANFPTVTICDNNALTSVYAQSLIDSIMNQTYGIDQYFNLSYWNAYNAMYNVTYLTKIYAQVNLTDAEKMQLGLNLNLNAFSILQNCKFNQQWCNYNWNTGLWSDFNWYFSFDYGNCFQFNSGKNVSNDKVSLKQVNREGEDFGLSLWIGPIIYYNTKYPTSDSKGLRVYIHDPSEAPPFSKGINVNVGQETNIAVTRSYKKSYPSPYSDCVDLNTFKPTEMYSFMMNSNPNVSYRQQDCLDLCFQQQVMTNCGCYYPKYLSLNPQTPPCLNLTQLICIYNQYSLAPKSQANNACITDQCPLECDTVEFNFQTSNLDYPNQATYNQLFSNPNGIAYYEYYYNITLSTFSSYQENFLVLNIYYPSTQYNLITESPKTLPFDLFSGIGGSLGIFIGLSVFHIVELFEALYLIFYVYFIKHR